MFDTVISGGVIISAHDRYKPLSGSVGITDGRIAYAGSIRSRRRTGAPLWTRAERS